MLRSSRRQAAKSALSRAVIETLENRQLMTVDVQPATGLTVVSRTENSVTVGFMDNSTEEDSNRLLAVRAEGNDSGGFGAWSSDRIAGQIDGSDTGYREMTVVFDAPGTYTLQIQTEDWTVPWAWSATTQFDANLQDVTTSSAAVEADGNLWIRWNDSSQLETGYVIERSLNGADWSYHRETGPDGTSVNLGNEAPGSYYFRVRAKYVGRGPAPLYGGWSSEMPVTVLPKVSLEEGYNYIYEPEGGWADYGSVWFERNTDMGETTVDFTVKGDAIRGEDYTLTKGSLVWNEDWWDYEVVETPLTGNSFTFEDEELWVAVYVTPLTDDWAEDNETVHFELAQGSGYTRHATEREATVTIFENDPEGTPVVTVALGSGAASEINAAARSFVFTRTGDLSESYTVNYSLVESSADVIADFKVHNDNQGSTSQAYLRSFTFGIGEKTHSVSIVPETDAIANENESVKAIVLDPDTPDIYKPQGSATMSIADIPVIWVEKIQDGDEDGRQAVKFRIHRTAGSGSLEVKFQLSGTAESGTPSQNDPDISLDGDYDVSQLEQDEEEFVARFTGSNPFVDIELPVFNDSDFDEGDETVILTVSEISANLPYVVGPAAQAGPTTTPSTTQATQASLTVTFKQDGNPPDDPQLRKWADDLDDFAPAHDRWALARASILDNVSRFPAKAAILEAYRGNVAEPTAALIDELILKALCVKLTAVNNTFTFAFDRAAVPGAYDLGISLIPHVGTPDATITIPGGISPGNVNTISAKRITQVNTQTVSGITITPKAAGEMAVSITIKPLRHDGTNWVIDENAPSFERLFLIEIQ